MINCVESIIDRLADTLRLVKEKRLIIISMRACVFFCIISFALGFVCLAISFREDWLHAKWAFPLGILWLVAGSLICSLVLEDFWVSRKMKRR